jgi:hypothetical protein
MALPVSVLFKNSKSADITTLATAKAIVRESEKLNP